MRFRVYAECPTCDGTGMKDKMPRSFTDRDFDRGGGLCSNCGGDGEVKTVYHVEITMEDLENGD